MKKAQAILISLLIAANAMILLSSYYSAADEYIVIMGYTKDNKCLFDSDKSPCFQIIINEYANKGYNFVGGFSASDKPYLVFKK